MNQFLNNLKAEGKLELVEPSTEIMDSYTEKANNCLKSAKILLQNNLFENSIGMSYYSMYNSTISLLFRVGIKCENHGAAILLLKLLFNNHELYELISNAKTERIDKRYFVNSKEDEITSDIAKELLIDAEDFVFKLKATISKLNQEKIEKLREKFKLL